LLPPFFFSRGRRHTSFSRDWRPDVCSSDLAAFAWSCQSAMAGTFNDTFNSFDPYGYDKFHQDLGNKKKYDAVGKIISRTGGGGEIGRAPGRGAVEVRVGAVEPGREGARGGT